MDLLTPKLEIFSDHETAIDDKHCDNQDWNINISLRPRINERAHKCGESETNAVPVKKYKKKRQQCTKCPANYSKREYLSKHMKNEHNITLEKKRPGRQSMFQACENDPRPYKCDQCVKEYTKSKHLARHRRTHLQTKLCNECKEICSNYAEHMLKKHGIDLPRPFECDICKKTYRTKTNIQSHMRIHRVASRIFACTVCPKSFCFATDLRKHMKTHSQSRHIICDICGDRFKSADTLKCHMRRHTGEKPYQCSQCPRAFSTSNSLDIHFRTHSGERPFMCEFCQKRFSDSSTLFVHKRLHTGENPYMCHLCGRRTKQASNLRSHYKHFHKNNDISGRQIRLNSRIFNRFTQTEIDAHLQESGDLMSLLERGLQEFYREENEKNSQIERALEVIKIPSAKPPIIPKDSKVESVPNKPAKPVELEIVQQVDEIVVKFENVKATKETDNAVTNAPTSLNTATIKTRHKEYGKVMTKYSPSFDSTNDLFDLPVNLSPLKIESVFIEDDECQPSEVANYPLSEIKNENESETENWPDSYAESSLSNDQFVVNKCELINTEKAPNLSEVANYMPKPEKINLENPEHQSESDKNDDFFTESNQFEQKTTKAKMAPQKIEMEKCIPCSRKFHDMTKHWLQYHSGIQRPYECYICHKNYKRFEHIKYHMRTHGDERNYICHICGGAFFLCNELRKHIMNRHQVERPFKCTHQQCKKCFKNQHALNVHMRTHSGVKPFVCAVCSEAFSALSSLKIHERKHTGERPFVCKFCKKAFADCSTHKQHVRIHTGEKPYRCHLCDRRTAQAGNLKSHYRHYHKIIVKSVSMYVDQTTMPFADEISRNPYERSHEITAAYSMLDPSRRIEE